MCKWHVDGSLPSDNAVFVFGSNDDGAHGAGAAKVAEKRFGAKRGVAEGLTNAAYAIPTVGRKLAKKRFHQIVPPINRFIEFVKDNPQIEFFVTRVGCKLAGFSDADVAPLFRDLVNLDNVSLPLTWEKYLTI